VVTKIGPFVLFIFWGTSEETRTCWRRAQIVSSGSEPRADHHNSDIEILEGDTRTSSEFRRVITPNVWKSVVHQGVSTCCWGALGGFGYESLKGVR